MNEYVQFNRLHGDVVKVGIWRQNDMVGAVKADGGNLPR